MAANPERGEVELHLGDLHLTLKLDWTSVTAIAEAWREDGEDWTQVLDQAFAEYDMPKIAFFIAEAAQHHHPDSIGPDDVMRASPPRKLVADACYELVTRFFWGDDGPPKEVREATAPFARLLERFARMRSDTASIQPNSGG